jgi:hypothetical protein
LLICVLLIVTSGTYEGCAYETQSSR